MFTHIIVINKLNTLHRLRFHSIFFSLRALSHSAESIVGCTLGLAALYTSFVFFSIAELLLNWIILFSFVFCSRIFFYAPTVVVFAGFFLFSPLTALTEFYYALSFLQSTQDKTTTTRREKKKNERRNCINASASTHTTGQTTCSLLSVYECQLCCI